MRFFSNVLCMMCLDHCSFRRFRIVFIWTHLYSASMKPRKVRPNSGRGVGSRELTLHRGAGATASFGAYKPLCLLSDNNRKWFPDKKLDKARSLLYRSQILQENMHWKALAEIYTMHFFAPFSNLNFFVKNCWNLCWFLTTFRKLCQNFINLC